MRLIRALGRACKAVWEWVAVLVQVGAGGVLVFGSWLLWGDVAYLVAAVVLFVLPIWIDMSEGGDG